MNSVYKPCQSAKLRNFINIAYIVATRGPSGPKKLIIYIFWYYTQALDEVKRGGREG